MLIRRLGLWNVALARRVADERLRIARELHDTLAHSLVAINVRAGVAVDLEDAEDRYEALRDIKQVSSTALRDLRATLSLLREEGDAAPTAPAFALEAPPALVDRAVAEAYPTGSPQDASTSNLISHLRGTVIPRAVHGTSAIVYVGGQTALSDDEATQLAAKLPLFVGAVVALSFLLLMLVFRSLLIPATAAVMNLLSAGAAFGVITAVFEKGFLGSVAGISHTGPISPLAPILMFAVLFGLSMDYEVFLVSRMHEVWLKTRDNAQAVNRVRPSPAEPSPPSRSSWSSSSSPSW